MRQGCCFVIEVSEDMRQRIDALDTGGNANTNDLRPEYWAVIWEMATTDKEGGLAILARRILTFIIPNIERMYEQIRLFRRLRMEDRNSKITSLQKYRVLQDQPPTPPAPTRD